jgi:hypothetical protein
VGGKPRRTASRCYERLSAISRSYDHPPIRGGVVDVEGGDRTRVEALLVVIELSHIDGAETSVSRCSFDRLNTVFEAIHLPLQPPELREGRWPLAASAV